jgi:CheY-like chemotaxis protein/HPt (histidine-containing phosphotransfer) domain-containing protein
MQPDSSHGGRILLVEDSAVLRQLILGQLKALGLSATAVTNGLEALEELSSHPYALVLLDCQLPEMDGFELTRQVRAGEAGTGRHLPIIAMSASTTQEVRSLCLSAGMDDQVGKPLSRSDLEKLVQDWISRSRARSEQTPAYPLDFARLEKSYGEAACLKLLGSFLTDSGKAIAQMETAANTEDLKKLLVAAHQLKGLAMAFEVNGLPAVIAEIRLLAENESWAETREQIAYAKKILDGIKLPGRSNLSDGR